MLNIAPFCHRVFGIPRLMVTYVCFDCLEPASDFKLARRRTDLAGSYALYCKLAYRSRFPDTVGDCASTICMLLFRCAFPAIVPMRPPLKMAPRAKPPLL